MSKIPAYYLLLLATLLWGGNFVIGKAVATSLPPFTFAFLRWIIALCIFLPIVWKSLKHDLPVILSHWKIVIILAFTGVAAYNTLVYYGVHYTTSINASLMNMLTPIFIYIFSFLFLKETLNRYQVIGTLISFVGVLVILSNGHLTSIFHLSFNKGDFIVMIAVILWSIYSLLIKQFSTKLPGKTTFFVSICLGTFILFPFFLYEQFVTTNTIVWSGLSLFAIFYTGIFASIIAFLAWNTGIIKYGANRAGIYLNFIPVFASIFALLFLKESLVWTQLVGGLFVILGVFVTGQKKEKRM
ncbi:DMT family transporter [Kurthia senegalensis]|uniref:DMT family transporter n=1 Tax=Kurthia senegalensis TaxID=1033740 RepID=UPI0002880B40|nr:DMT family transporter [Kurthia senegalensis]